MSDFNSSLPIRTEQDGDVVIKVGDGLVPSQHLTVNADGSVNITDNGQSLTVDATNFDIRDLDFATDKVDVTGSDVTATVTATDLDIRDLTFAQDKVDASGSVVALDAATLAALESITVSATDLDIRDLAFATDKVDASGSVVALDAATLAALESITVTATDLDVRDLAFATDKVDVSGSTVVVTAADLDIRDLTSATDSVAVKNTAGVELSLNADGSLNVVTQEDPGTETTNFNAGTAVAAGASSTHDLVFATSSKLYQVIASASGLMKVEIQVETGSATGVFTTLGVQFNSTATPNINFALTKYAAIPAGARVRVIRTNKDKQAQDLYSTINGVLGL